jgi:predicted kinase
MPTPAAASAVRKEVATAVIRNPSATRRPSAAMAKAAVLPVPIPTRMPSATSETAASAAARFQAVWMI